MGIHHRPCTSEDPQSNGLTESFVKLLCKLVSLAEEKDPQRESYKTTFSHSAPHHTTQHPLHNWSLTSRNAEHQIRTKLSQHFETRDTELQKNARGCHDKNKFKQKTITNYKKNYNHLTQSYSTSRHKVKVLEQRPEKVIIPSWEKKNKSTNNRQEQLNIEWVKDSNNHN